MITICPSRHPPPIHPSIIIGRQEEETETCIKGDWGTGNGNAAMLSLHGERMNEQGRQEEKRRGKSTTKRHAGMYHFPRILLNDEKGKRGRREKRERGSSSPLRQLLQLPLLLSTQRLIQPIEIRNILPPSPNKELRQICLRLVISLPHETPLSFTVRHEFSFGGPKAEVEG